jgi:hypothetical protein
MFHENVRYVANHLTHTLHDICQGRLKIEAPAQISNIVHGLGILALEMGSQRAHVYLEICSYQDRIKSGEHFKDSNGLEGSNVQVDLMLQPCMIRVGDGREDLDTQKVVALGDVVSLKASQY